MNPPPIPRDEVQARRDDEHLNLLAVFHFVLGGFALLGVGFIVVHYSIMGFFFNNPAMWKEAKSGPPPQEIFQIFVWIYLLMAVIFVAMGAMNIMSGMFLRKKKNKMFSMVVAGINCLQFPFGTALGVFTIIVLQRASVGLAYDEASR